MRLSKLNVALLFTVMGLNGCSDALIGQQDQLTVQFASITPPVDGPDIYQIRSTEQVWVNGEAQKIAYRPFLTVGDKDNGEIYGALKNVKDEPILALDGSPVLCNGTDSGVGSGLDHISILQKHDKLYLVSQFECGPGAMYVNELQQNDRGRLTPVKGTLQYISQKAGFGGWVHCAGVTTPWQSHLGSEEYEPDANPNSPKPYTDNKYFKEVSRSFWQTLDQANPYFYGWTPEVSMTSEGEAKYVKHYAMGRFAHELAYVMPDNRTVYLSDDGAGGALFMFIADKAKDLSSGHLYAAKWQQTSDTGLGEATLSWVSLGKMDNETVQAYVAQRPVFSDLFKTAKMSQSGHCPMQGTGLDGKSYAPVNTAGGIQECLQLKDVNLDKVIDAVDMALASRLESRRMAGLLGATTEFDKMEGITFNPNSNQLYLAMSQIRKGMEDQAKKGTSNLKYDLGSNNDIRLDYNPCGGVYALSVAKAPGLNSDFVAYQIQGLVAGQKKDYAHTPFAGNTCDLDRVANPDNVTYLPGSNSLVIGEDTAYHHNDIIWSYNLQTQQLERLVSTAYGSETTSPFWYRDINGFGYLTLVSQHPFGEVPRGYQRPENAEIRSQGGYLGPFKFTPKHHD